MIVRVRKLTAFAAFMILLLSHLDLKAQQVSDDQTLAIAQSVVHLIVVATSGETREGSGVIVHPEGIIFTAQHVIEDASEIRVELLSQLDLPPTFGYYARIRYESDIAGFDFAILEVFANDQGTIEPRTLNLPFIEASHARAVVREEIEIFGYLESAGGGIHVTHGIIGSIQQRVIGNNVQQRYPFYQSDAVFGDGDSGGLVVNAEDEFIGIPIEWQVSGENGYVVVILPLSTICEVHAAACALSARSGLQDRYHLVPLPDADSWTENLGLRAGTVELGGVTFDVGHFTNTRGCPPVEMMDEIFIPVNISTPFEVHFLIQAGNAYSRYMGIQLGEIALEFSDGSTLLQPLILGENIRDWSRNSDVAVTTITDSITREGWEGTTPSGTRGGMDIISLPVPPEFQNANLVSIYVRDTSNVSSGAEPCIHLQAITVQSR